MDEEEGIAWDAEDVSEDVRDVSSMSGKVVKVCETREASLLAGSSVGVERKRRSIHVPKSSLRSPSFAGRRGWAKRRVGHGLFRRWKREYLSLWGDCMLYFHKDKDGSDMFLSGKNSSNETKGEINLKEVVSVRVSPVGPGTSGHRGIELESCLSGKV